MEGGGMLRQYLTCPISLQPMRDPVTAPSGISYDRCAIERWLAAGHATCPVTGQPLALADLTPNHTLRRLIQSWSRTPRSAGEDDGKPSGEQEDDDADVVRKLLSMDYSCPPVDALRAAAETAAGSDDLRRRMVRGSVVPRVLHVLVACARKIKISSEEEGGQDAVAVEACLALLRALLDGDEDPRPPIVAESSHDVIDALTDALVVLLPGDAADAARASAMQLLEHAMESASAPALARLRPELFTAMTAALRARASPSTIRAALRWLLHACAAAARNQKLKGCLIQLPN